MANILIVDDDPSLREVLEIALNNHQHKNFCAANIAQALEILGREVLDLVLLDVKLGQENGIDLLKTIKQKWPQIPVLMITAYADSQTAVQAMKLGAKDYISKPFDIDELMLQIDNTLESSRLIEENRMLKEQLENRYNPMLGESETIREVFNLINRIAPTNINVLITGESGTGKELVARYIHGKSNRSYKNFMVINCGGIPENLVESELFGYRKGAFTGADRHKKGLLEKADQGSLLLDEIGEMPHSIQVKLLRCIQDGSFIPIGGTDMVNTDVRFIAATNREIEKDVATGSFREDLFYRISGVIIKLPPLRERGEDLLLISEYFLDKFASIQNKSIKGFTAKAKEKLLQYHYPGNIRELENIIERAVALEGGEYITPSSLIIYDYAPVENKSGPEKVLKGEISLDEYLEKEDRKILHSALERTSGHKAQAAEMLGLSFRQFRYRLSKYKLNMRNN